MAVCVCAHLYHTVLLTLCRILSCSQCCHEYLSSTSCCHSATLSRILMARRPLHRNVVIKIHQIELRYASRNQESTTCSLAGVHLTCILHTCARQIDRQTDRQAGRQADRQTASQAGRQADKQTDTHTHTDRHTDGHTDRHTDRHTNTHTHTRQEMIHHRISWVLNPVHAQPNQS